LKRKGSESELLGTPICRFALLGQNLETFHIDSPLKPESEMFHACIQHGLNIRLNLVNWWVRTKLRREKVRLYKKGNAK
jgi:hypothetical protein